MYGTATRQCAVIHLSCLIYFNIARDGKGKGKTGGVQDPDKDLFVMACCTLTGSPCSGRLGVLKVPKTTEGTILKVTLSKRRCHKARFLSEVNPVVLRVKFRTDFRQGYKCHTLYIWQRRGAHIVESNMITSFRLISYCKE